MILQLKCLWKEEEPAANPRLSRGAAGEGARGLCAVPMGLGSPAVWRLLPPPPQAWGHSGDAHTGVGSWGCTHMCGRVTGGCTHTSVGSRGCTHRCGVTGGCTHTGVGSRADAHTGVDRCVRVPGVHMHALCTDVLSAHTDTRSSLWWHDHAGIAWGRGWLLCSVGVARVTWPVVQL